MCVQIAGSESAAARMASKWRDSSGSSRTRAPWSTTGDSRMLVTLRLAADQRIERRQDAREDRSRTSRQGATVDALDGHEPGAGTHEKGLVGGPQIVGPERGLARRDAKLPGEGEDRVARDALQSAVACRGRE